MGSSRIMSTIWRPSRMTASISSCVGHQRRTAAGGKQIMLTMPAGLPPAGRLLAPAPSKSRKLLIVSLIKLHVNRRPSELVLYPTNSLSAYLAARKYSSHSPFLNTNAKRPSAILTTVKRVGCSCDKAATEILQLDPHQCVTCSTTAAAVL